jgi:hypothetical protein
VGKELSPDKSRARDEYAKILKARGWTIDKTRGKGGHWWCTKPGCMPFPLPKKIKPGLESELKKILGLRN